MKIGYARVAKENQGLEKQCEELLKEGCDKIYADVCSGLELNRSGLNSLLANIQHGDRVVAYDRSRISRSINDFTKIVLELKEKDVQLDFIK